MTSPFEVGYGGLNCIQLVGLEAKGKHSVIRIRALMQHSYIVFFSIFSCRKHVLDSCCIAALKCYLLPLTMKAIKIKVQGTIGLDHGHGR